MGIWRAILSCCHSGRRRTPWEAQISREIKFSRLRRKGFSPSDLRADSTAGDSGGFQQATERGQRGIQALLMHGAGAPTEALSTKTRVCGAGDHPIARAGGFTKKRLRCLDNAGMLIYD